MLAFFKYIKLKSLNKKAESKKSLAQDIIAAIDVKKGQYVADIGSGGGYFAFEFAKKVSPAGLVYALDIDSFNLDYINKEALKRGIQNIKTGSIAPSGKAELKENSIDVLFFRNVFHHLKSPSEYFANLKKYLKNEAKVVIIDYNEKKGFSSLFHHYTEEKSVARNMEKAGYRMERAYDFLPGQFFHIYRAGELL
ncbi:MAG: methyltransferase domain-containing protein [Candidatus Aureabacteria bacterium]|nr:methyltransferase domain-containing protein [Candidatus Auribacterota bacterium]